MTPVWNDNLQALSLRREPPLRELFQRLQTAGPWTGEVPLSRTGTPLPTVTQGHRVRPLESQFDPRQEAQRWVEGLPAEAAVVVFGGAPTDLWTAVGTLSPSLVVNVDPRVDVWRSLFTTRDFTPFLALPHWYFCCAEVENWTKWLSGRYHPLWDGSLTAKDWRAATDGWDALWSGYKESLRAALLAWTGDFSTQARFGARWYRNSLLNLKFLKPAGLDWNRPAGAIVAGAGPGLETALNDTRNQALLAGRPANGWRLLATDTALPALLARGVVPDAVLCLDGQLPSAHHFHAPIPSGLPLVADLASIPLFQRMDLHVVPFLSGHPLGKIVSRHYSGLPRLDGASGNVSGLGLSFAEALGARETHLWGADFSYPWGKSYARGTYVYPLHSRNSNRLTPSETRLTAGCYGAEGLQRLNTQGDVRYTTPLLRDYRGKMLALAAALPTSLAAPPVPGLSDFPQGAAQRGTERLGDPAWRRLPVQGRWEEFRTHWQERLRTLPRPPRNEPLVPFVERLEASRQEDWLALWPLALALHRLQPRGPDFLDKLVEKALEPLQD